MYLLGMQMEHELSSTQQKEIDMAVKAYLAGVNRVRQENFAMPSMTAAALPPGWEMTMRMSAQWEQQEEEENWRREQGGDQAELEGLWEYLAEEWESDEEEMTAEEGEEEKQD